MAKGRTKEKPVLMRAVRFELKPTEAQEKLFVRISDGLQSVYNAALEERMAAWALWKEEKAQREKAIDAAKVIANSLGATVVMTVAQIRLPTLFDQINALTAQGAKDRESGLWRSHIPRNWKEEALDALDGAFKSFFALWKKGDKDARPPRLRDPEYFNEIPGRKMSFTIKDDFIVLAKNTFKDDVGVPLAFPIPEYQARLMDGKNVKKFTLFRDNPKLSEPGRWWISLVYEIDKPEPLAFRSDSAVYLSVGATWLGVLAPDREEVIELWRPDKHWKPEIEAVEARIKSCKKGSRAWHRRTAARRKMFRVMSAQQKQNHREVVARRLLEMGVHFVVEDLTIRGGLADASKPNRKKLNWSVQNTGSIAELVAWLGTKAAEHGGFVIKHKPAELAISGVYGANKIPMAERLKKSFRDKEAVGIAASG